jgi:hypothetical protein
VRDTRCEVASARPGSGGATTQRRGREGHRGARQRPRLPSLATVARASVSAQLLESALLPLYVFPFKTPLCPYVQAQREPRAAVIAGEVGRLRRIARDRS